MPTRGVKSGGVELDGCVDGIYRGDQRFLVGKKVVFKDVEREEEKGLVKNSWNQSVFSCSDDESSSSIGKNSDLSENSMEKSGDGEEVQSSYKGALDSMEALEEVLPIRRGISRFYNGKSKSFASLADAASMKDLAKPDNTYMRRRRSLLACSLAWDKNRSSPLRSSGGGISKRATSSGRTTLALAVAMSSSVADKQAGECSSTGSVLAPSPGKDFSTWRSYSLADLQQCVSDASTCTDSDQLATSRIALN